MNWLDNWKWIKTVFTGFFQERNLTNGAALAYYSVLALVPLLYLSISIFGRVVGADVMHEVVSNVLHDFLGIRNTSGVFEFTEEVDFSKGSFVLETIGTVVLLFSSTAILNSMRRSINECYSLSIPPYNARRKIVRSVLFRLISVGFIAGITVVLVVLYFAETAFLSLSVRFIDENYFLGQVTILLVQYVLPILTNMFIFTFVFKFLHDGIVKWKRAIEGAILTSILLYIGQLLIKYYLTSFFFAADGGIAGTLLIILVWVYYSSQIIFLGAKYIQVKSRERGEPIRYRD